MSSRGRIDACVHPDCDRTEVEIKARGMCARCTQRTRRNGTYSSFPIERRGAKSRLDSWFTDYELIGGRSMSIVALAQRFSCSTRTIERRLSQARQQGLLT